MTRKTLDDFLEVLKWSTHFGVDTENGRDLKKSVVPVLAAGAFNSREKVAVNDKRITLSQYACRLNVKLLRSADFNAKLREHEVGKNLSVQKICRACKDEKEVRLMLDLAWKEPSKIQETMHKKATENQEIFQFETLLESMDGKRRKVYN